MIPASFSIKGFASIRFANNKENMNSGKIWSMLANIWSYYPEKVQFMVSSQRGSQDKSSLEDEKVRDAMYKMISGCIDTCSVQAAIGRSTNLLLGSCFEYRIPFGVRSSDVGHETMVLPLPLPMDGCYILSAQFDGAFRKQGTKEYYMAEMNLDIHVGTLTAETYEGLLGRGTKVFPFKLKHPEYFVSGDSSESEFTTDASDDETGHERDRGTKGIGRERTKSILRPSPRKSSKRRVMAGAAIRSALEYIASSSGKDVPKKVKQGRTLHTSSANLERGDQDHNNDKDKDVTADNHE